MNSLYYKEVGAGSTLVFLHGFCETHEIWDDIIAELANDYNIIALDLPGFGKSDEIPPSLSLKEVGQVVISLLTSLGVQKCIVIGHSLGGYVALAIAEERPDLIAGVCLFHSTALPDTEEKKLNRLRVMDFVRNNGVKPFIETFVPGLFFQKHLKNIERVYKIALKTPEKTLLAYTKAMCDRPDMTGFLRTFEKPILFLAGEKDTFIAGSSLAEQARVAFDGQLKVLTETGHMGMIEDCEGSITILKDFGQTCFHPVAL